MLIPLTQAIDDKVVFVATGQVLHIAPCDPSGCLS